MGIVWDERTILDDAWISCFSFNEYSTFNCRISVGIVYGAN